MKLILFGAGSDGQQRLKDIRLKPNFKIICFVDNDKNKHGTMVDNIQIFPPSMVHELEFDRILITSCFFQEIEQQLLEMGIPANMFYSAHRGIPKQGNLYHVFKPSFKMLLDQMSKTQINHKAFDLEPPKPLGKVVCSKLNQHDLLKSYDRKDSVIVLMHLPKTGGTSLETMAFSQFRPSEVLDISNFHVTEQELASASSRFWDGIKLIITQSYNQFNIHQYISKRIFYLAVIRKPVDRMVSDYYYSLEKRDHHFNEIAYNNLSIFEFAILRTNIYNNLQTRLISGEIQFDKKSNTDSVKCAIRNLDQQPSMMIPINKLNNSLHHLTKFFGWKELNPVKRNKRNNPIKPEDHPDTILNILNLHHEVDNLLYQFLSNEYDKSFTLEKSKKPKTFRTITTMETEFPKSGVLFLYGNPEDKDLCLNYMSKSFPNLKVADWIEAGPNGPRWGHKWAYFQMLNWPVIPAAIVKNHIILSEGFST